MKKFLQKQFISLSEFDFFLAEKRAEGIRIFLLWVIPSLILFYLIEKYFPHSVRLHKAIQEGIGPNLWNVIGAFGLFSFGLSIIFPHSKWILKSAKNILENTFAIGCLSIGLLIGQWFFALNHNDLEWWKVGFWGVTSGALIFVVIVFNFCIWYLATLVNTEKLDFMNRISKINFIWRLLIGISICFIIYAMFITTSNT